MMVQQCVFVPTLQNCFQMTQRRTQTNGGNTGHFVYFFLKKIGCGKRFPLYTNIIPEYPTA